MLSALDPGIRVDHMILHLLPYFVLVVENITRPLIEAFEYEHLIERRARLHDLLDELNIVKSLLLHCANIIG